MTEKQKEKFKQVILEKIDERERMGFDCLTDSDVMDILEELDRRRIPYTREDLIKVGLERNSDIEVKGDNLMLMPFKPSMTYVSDVETNIQDAKELKDAICPKPVS